MMSEKKDNLTCDVKNITTEKQLHACYPLILKHFNGSQTEALNFLAENLIGLDLSAMMSFLSTLRLEKSTYYHLAMNSALYKKNETQFMECEKRCLSHLRIPDYKISPLQALQRKAFCKPTVSIICAVYNQEYFIDRTVSSLVSQSVDDIEILFLDDCSTDSSLERLKNWQRRLPGIIKIISMKQNILSKKKSPGELLFRLCSGHFVAFCDGDDFWVGHQRLGRQIGFLEHRPDLVSCSYNMIYWDTIAGTSSLASADNYCRIDYPDNLKKVSNLLWNNTLLIRRVFNRIPDEFFLTDARDAVFTSYLGQFGGNIHHGQVVGGVQRRNQLSVWNPRSEAEKNSERFKSRHAIKMLLKRLGDHHLMEYCDYRIERLGISEESAEHLLSGMKNKIAEGVYSSRIDDSEYELIGF